MYSVKLTLLPSLALFVSLFLSLSQAAEEWDSSKVREEYCYDNCSGHGRCVRNACVCEPGWYGENCATRFGATPLSVGHLNVSSVAEIRHLYTKHESILFGISSSQCAKCGLAEPEYAQVEFGDVPFVRVDAAKIPNIVSTLGVDPASPPPLIVLAWTHGKKHGLYRGPHSARALNKFIRQKVQPRRGFRDWTRTDELRPPTLGEDGEETDVVVVGFFPTLDEDDTEFDEFAQAAMDIRSRHDIQVFRAVVPNKKQMPVPRPRWFPPITVALPALGVAPLSGVDDSSEWKFITLTEPVPSWSAAKLRPSFADWISLNAIPIVAKLIPETFSAMEEVGLPMLLVFSPSVDIIRPLLPSLRDAAKEFRGKITVMYDDEGVFKDKMRVLGLMNPDKLSMAMNTRDVGPVPFLGDVISNHTFRLFCMDYLAGRAVPLNKLRDAISTPQKGSSDNNEEDDLVGVREGFYATDIGITDVSDATSWTRHALDESKDVILFVYRSTRCLPCKQLAPFYKKMARRLVDLKRTTTPNHHLVCARVDLDRFRPEGLMDVSVPAIALLPAYNKSPPFRFFSAIAKVFTMMEWARENAGRPFEWGEELPQFDAEEKILFKEQIRMREEARSAKSKRTDEL